MAGSTVAWVQEILLGLPLPESRWRWTWTFACHWERDGGRTRGDGPVEVGLDEALQWAHDTADVVTVKVGDVQRSFVSTSFEELRARVGPPPRRRPLQLSTRGDGGAR